MSSAERRDLRDDAERILQEAIAASLPDAAVRRALVSLPEYRGRLVVVAVGKAAWRMASAAREALGDRIDRGIVITKYGHLGGELPGFSCWEAGHPVPDGNGFRATEDAIRLVQNLTPDDLVLFLLSGGGSALLEKPLVPPEELLSVTEQLLRSGADIGKINAVRKRLSAVKGGRFALLCRPARVYGVLLSDVLGDVPDRIGSGPVCPDASTAAEALAVAEQYRLRLRPETLALLQIETPKSLENVSYTVGGSVRGLCDAAMESCRRLGYRPVLLTAELTSEAREAGAWLAGLAVGRRDTAEPLALLAGGETVVHVVGSGLGGRNQELALSAAREIDGIPNVAVFSFGSDGTDGPTDAAGGFADGGTLERLRAAGVDINRALRENDAYHALLAIDGLLVTGPTGTNVNDLSVALILPETATNHAGFPGSGACRIVQHV